MSVYNFTKQFQPFFSANHPSNFPNRDEDIGIHTRVSICNTDFANSSNKLSSKKQIKQIKAHEGKQIDIEILCKSSVKQRDTIANATLLMPA